MTKRVEKRESLSRYGKSGVRIWRFYVRRAQMGLAISGKQCFNGKAIQMIDPCRAPLFNAERAGAVRCAPGMGLTIGIAFVP